MHRSHIANLVNGGEHAGGTATANVTTAPGFLLGSFGAITKARQRGAGCQPEEGYCIVPRLLLSNRPSIWAAELRRSSSDWR